MKKIFFIAFAIIWMLLVFSGCDKANEAITPPVAPPATQPTVPLVVCELVKITGESPNTLTTIELSYNNDRQLSVVRQTGGNGAFTKVLNYSGKTIIANSTGTSSRVDSVILNDNGLIAFSQSKNTITPALISTTINKFTYASNGELVKSTSQVNNGAISTTNYHFVNGDLISSDGADNAVYTYYTDRLFADGDFLKLFQLLNQNGLFVKNKHLIKSVQRGTTIQNFIYDFDAAGKIIKLTSTSGTTVESLNYQFSCK